MTYHNVGLFLKGWNEYSVANLGEFLEFANVEINHHGDFIQEQVFRLFFHAMRVRKPGSRIQIYCRNPGRPTRWCKITTKSGNELEFKYHSTRGKISLKLNGRIIGIVGQDSPYSYVASLFDRV